MRGVAFPRRSGLDRPEPQAVPGAQISQFANKRRRKRGRAFFACGAWNEARRCAQAAAPPNVLRQYFI